MIKNVKKPNKYIHYKFTGKKSETFTFKLRNNIQLVVPKKIIPEFKESFFEEVYYKNLPKSLLKKDNPTIIDIGANVGFFSILSILKFKNPNIISFEPIKRNFDMLKKNISEINQKNLRIVNKAVSNTNGEIILKFDKNQDITTSASIFDNKYGNDEEKVVSTTLLDIFSEYKLNEIDVLKLDCEGAEYEIIYNTPKSFFDKVKCITLETHLGEKTDENNTALEKYFISLGYKTKIKSGNFIWAYKALN